MNEKIKELMLANDYAAPEIAIKAQKLVEEALRSYSYSLMDIHAVDIPKMQLCAKHYGVEL